MSGRGNERSDDPRPQEPVAARLRRRFGEGIDPEIELDARAAPAAPAPTNEVLRRLAEGAPRGTRYGVQGEIARGGMGAIFAVWDEDLRRSLAMKVALPAGEGSAARELLRAHPQMLARFLEEAQVTGQLDHPGIVPVHELGIDADGRLYFTMRLVKGRDLKQIFDLVRQEQEGWSTTRALGVMLKVCEAVAYAHAKGVIHRDLKPANIMVGHFGEVYVMDWGLARVVGREDRHDIKLRVDAGTSIRTGQRDERALAPDSPLVTMDGDVVGTPCYMAPEQAQGRIAEVGPRADVYSLGAMLYHLLTGEMPYVPAGSRVSNHTVLGMVLQGPPRPVHAIRRDVPAELAAICEKAMARKAEERYSDTLAMAEDLRAYLEHRVVRAYETGALAEMKKWIARNRGLALASAAAAGAVIVGLAAVGYVQAAGRAKVLRLSDGMRLAESLAEAEDLWPALPERAAALEGWLGRARGLAANLPAHRAVLADLRGSALSGGAAGAWSFADTESQWQHDTLAELVLGLERFVSQDPAAGTIADVERRLEFARTVQRRTIGERAGEWSAAIASIQDTGECPLYAGLVIRPQLGLVPIGRDRDSGLWEFAHLQSGRVSERDPETGKLSIAEDTGLVLVLVPGSAFSMGAQAADPVGARYDPSAVLDEGPVHVVALDPYFISKLEMTQAQWMRAGGSNPAHFAPGAADADPRTSRLHPVETVSSRDCLRVLRRLDLTLPTEAQWERAARAGTDTVWWTGDTTSSLRDAANLSDGWNAEGAPTGWPADVGIDDGWGRTAPVGTYRANPFGLHDTIGNVWEWCLDGCGSYTDPVRAGTGERLPANPPGRSVRGGSFYSLPVRARSACRDCVIVDNVDEDCGLRPARRLDR